jgi:DNA-binding MarR family transcriptional regulator
MTDQAKILQQAVTTILRALKIAETDIRIAHKELNFVPADIQTLRFVSQNAGCMLSDLATHLGIVPTTASSIVDRLVNRGFLRRERPVHHRRAICLQLTDIGADGFVRLENEERITIRIMLGALQKANRAKFIENMATIAARVSLTPHVQSYGHRNI